MTIRKFLLAANSLDQLVRRGSLSQEAADFLDSAVQAGVNIVVSGPTGSGKTTFLNCLARFWLLASGFWLLALTTGHDGSLGTIHGSSPRDALDRLATLALMAEERLSKEAAIEMVARTMDLVVQVRFSRRIGRRQVVSIFEVAGLEGDVLTGHEIWGWDPQAEQLTWKGIAPRCLDKMAERSIPYAPPPPTLLETAR